AMTQAVVDAENGSWPHPELRVCVFTCEIPDGWWGGAGRIIRLPDIYELVWPLKPGVDGQPRETADHVLSERRREAAERALAAARDQAGSWASPASPALRARGRQAPSDISAGPHGCASRLGLRNGIEDSDARRETCRENWT